MASKKQSGRTGQKSFLSLPRLRAGHGIQVPIGHEWTANEYALSYISRNIDVQNSSEKGHSIPDIFSQCIQFEFDLGIGNADSVGQWQGLLATLFLAGGSGQVRLRRIIVADLPDSPFVRVFRGVALRRGVHEVTMFELKRQDGDYAAVAFRYDGMPTMLCPAAEIKGPFVLDDPWIIRTESGGWTFTTPFALMDDPRYADRRIALRNEIYALSTRVFPAKENRDGVQLMRLQEFFRWLSRGGDAISNHPINDEVRGALYTVDPSDKRKASEVFTDRLCLFRVGDAYNHRDACAAETMIILSGGRETEWRALLPLKRDWAISRLPQLRTGALRVRMRWFNGAVDAELLNESDAVLDARRYRIQDLINYMRHRNAPQIAVWPPKAMVGWNRYYLLRYDDGNALPLSVYVLGAGEAKRDVTMLTRMPQGLSFSLEDEEVGMLMPAFLSASNNKARELNLGFDFGTTGTTAYKHDPQSDTSSPVSFAGQGALFLFGRKESAEVALTAQLISERIPARATHYSLLRRKAEAAHEGGALLDATIPFLSSGAFNQEIVRDVSDDLKWGTLASDKLRANLFLEQYIMMCLWHAVENGASGVHWRASYPLSMHGKLQDDFIAKLQSIISGLCTHCYRIPYETHFCSESEAVGFMMMDNNIQARYLKGFTVNDNTGFFCIDIGGGTTDLSLWLRRKPVMQASLRWAGNAILGDSITRENHGEDCPPRTNLIDFFFLPGTSEGKRAALLATLEEGRFSDFRRIWNILVDEITDAVKGLHRQNEPLLNYMNIVRLNLFMIFFFAGRMVREALLSGVKVGVEGVPLPVSVLGNGAKMMGLLYNDVEMLQRPRSDGNMEIVPQERRNAARYEEEMARFKCAFEAGCGLQGFEAVIIEPFMPKQETARGLALAPEAFLSQRASQMDGELAQGGWPSNSAYEINRAGVAEQQLTDEYSELVQESFAALREVFQTDDAFREFLTSLFPAPDGENRFSIDAYYRSVWAQCLRHNPEPMLPGQPLPQKNTIAGRFVEMLSAMNRMMRTAG